MMVLGKQYCCLLLILPLVHLINAQCPTVDCTCETITSGIRINCRNKQLLTIPIFTDTGVIYSEITFSSSDTTGCSQCNKITSIPANAFANLQVKKIDLTKNAISSVDTNAFVGLVNILEELRLEGAVTNAPPYAVLGSLTGLTSLQLQSYMQSREQFVNNNFENLNNLQKLTLQKFSGLTDILSSSFQGKLPVLQSLHLKDIPLQAVPVEALQQLLKLEILELSSTNITQIFSDTFTPFSELRELYISNNGKLQTLKVHAFMGINDTLQFLYLAHNDLGKEDLVSLSSLHWTALQQLNLAYNYLNTIDDNTFEGMPNLAYLNLQENNLNTVGSSLLQGLGNLHTLDLSLNSISSIQSSAFSATPKLSSLVLYSNGVPLNLQPSAFTGPVAESITQLDISLSHVDATSLWNTLRVLTNLRKAKFDQAGLTGIPDDAFEMNTRINQLILSGNSISTLSARSFFGLRDSLEKITLTNTDLTTISECVFKDFSVLSEIHLTNAPLHCDCGLEWLYDWLHEKSPDNPFSSVVILAGAVCNSPASIRSNMLYNLQKVAFCSNPVAVQCPDLYTTTTTTSTTTTTTTTTTQTPAVLPTFTLHVTLEATDYIMVDWVITPNRNGITNLILEYVFPDGTERFQLQPTEDSYRFKNLEPNTAYTLCLYLEMNNIVQEGSPNCVTANTEAVATTTPVVTTSAPQNQVPVIVGAAVGSLVFLALVIVIIYLLVRYNKKPKRVPVDSPGIVFTTQKSGELPTAGGGARKFHKGGKEGATGTDDIDIRFVPGNTMDKDRMSAGSYQFLNETGKDVSSKPMPSTSASNGHYVNNVETRPLPKMPYGQKSSSKHGYENTGFKGSTDPMPETSKNSYSEVEL